MKEYTNGEIVVCWDPKRCIHAGECVRGLPQVFRRDDIPWVNIKAAGSEEIIKVIDRCPSGALSYKKVKTEEEADRPIAKIKIMKNGPLLVEGECALIEWTGKRQQVPDPSPSVGAAVPRTSRFAMGHTSRSDSTMKNK